jgi:hypothetical protein
MAALPANDLHGWLHLIEAEYREVPGLNLTRPQVQRMWSLDDGMCDALLGALVSSRFLEKTARDGYVLAGRAVPDHW